MMESVPDPLLSRISVVVPVLNCLDLVGSGMEHMRAWAPLVRELIVVDSQSTDGTLEYLREQLPFPQVSFHQRPRGLYAAWNHGISQCQGDWVHISTAGDTISLPDLRYLAEVAERSQADVVTAPPHFIHGEAASGHHPVWPIHHLLERHEGEELIVLEGLSLMAFTMEFCRLSQVIQCWLGSSASNLYRRRLFDSTSFPTDCGHSGDVMFSLRNAHRLRAAFVRRECGRFVMHPPTVPHQGMLEAYGKLYAEAYAEQLARLHEFVLRATRGEETETRPRPVFHPAEEASFLRAMAHSPEEALESWKREAELMRELDKKIQQRDELKVKRDALRGELESWKGRARQAEAALQHSRRRIPAFLRRLLNLDAPPAPGVSIPSPDKSRTR